MGKGSYGRGLIYRSKGRAGIKKRYKSHLRVVVRQAAPGDVKRTKEFARWEHAAKILEVPWEERIKLLPRYQPLPGYEPGTRRIPLLPITPR